MLLTCFIIRQPWLPTCVHVSTYGEERQPLENQAFEQHMPKGMYGGCIGNAYKCAYICTYVYIHIYIYTYVYIYIYTYKHSLMHMLTFPYVYVAHMLYYLTNMASHICAYIQIWWGASTMGK